MLQQQKASLFGGLFGYILFRTTILIPWFRIWRRLEKIPQKFVAFLLVRFRHHKSPRSALYKPDYPLINLNLAARVPASEEAANHIENQLFMLSQHANEFGAAVSLFEILMHRESTSTDHDEKITLLAWELVAARDGTVTIYNFAECMEGIKEQLHANSGLKGLVDWVEIRSITKEFNSKFPSYEQLRHGVTHAAEFVKSPKAREEHTLRNSFTGFGTEANVAKGLLIQQCLQGKKFLSAYRGFIRSYEITPETLQTLRNIRDRFIGAFKQPPSKQA
jgi:hypothetical protein